MVFFCLSWASLSSHRVSASYLNAAFRAPRQPVADAWEESTRDAGWEARQLSAAASFDESIWFAGGISTERAFSDVWKTNGIGQWEQISPSAPFSARSGSQLAATDAGLILAGGRLYPHPHNLFASFPMADVWFSPRGLHWQQLTASAPWGRRFGHQLLFVEGHGLLLMGGTNDHGMALNDVWFSTNGSSWQLITADAVWPPRSHFCAVAPTDGSGNVWIMGGENTATGVVYGDVWLSTDGGTRWTATQAGQVQPPSDDSAYDSSTSFQLDEAKQTHTPAAPSNATWAPRSMLSCVSYQQQLWVGPGLTLSNAQAGDMWRSSDGKKWTQVSSSVQWGHLYGYGMLVRPSGTIGGDKLLLAFGGAALQPNSSILPSSAVWQSTLDLLCQANGQVCFGHGVCKTAGVSPTGLVEVSPFVPGVSCQCDSGWLPPSCNVTECGPHNCRHGECTPATSQQGSKCKCFTGWSGQSCSAPVCLSGCEHGLCSAPGSCVCQVGWAGVSCRVRANWLQDLGQWVAMYLGTSYVLTVVVGVFGVVLQAALQNCVWLGPKSSHHIHTSAQSSTALQDRGLPTSESTSGVRADKVPFARMGSGTAAYGALPSFHESLEATARTQPLLSDVLSVSSDEGVGVQRDSPLIGRVALSSGRRAPSASGKPLGDLSFY